MCPSTAYIANVKSWVKINSLWHKFSRQVPLNIWRRTRCNEKTLLLPVKFQAHWSQGSRWLVSTLCSSLPSSVSVSFWYSDIFWISGVSSVRTQRTTTETYCLVLVWICSKKLKKITVVTWGICCKWNSGDIFWFITIIKFPSFWQRRSKKYSVMSLSIPLVTGCIPSMFFLNFSLSL